MGVEEAYLRGRIQETGRTIRELQRLASISFEELGVDEKYSMRYLIIVLVEAIGSMCLHIAMEDQGYEPISYRDCFMYLKHVGLIDGAEDLVKMVGLRNLLVHRYWSIDDLEVYNSVKDDFSCVEDLLRAVVERYGIR